MHIYNVNSCFKYKGFKLFEKYFTYKRSLAIQIFQAYTYRYHGDSKVQFDINREVSFF